jgi:hypothetical protein
MSETFSIDATLCRPSRLILPGDPEHDSGHEKGRWRVLQVLDKYEEDIDWFRRKFGKELGERKFFGESGIKPYDRVSREGNLLLVGGVATIWQWAVGNGVGTTGNALCWLNNANATLGIGDSSTAEALNQVDLQAATNKYYQAMDASYPLTVDGTGATAMKTITAASNASPISVTSTSHGYASGDIIYVSGVGGNTAANGIWQITVVDANTYTLTGSSGNGAYTSGGTSTKSNIIVFKATIGTSNANYAWNEWCIKNGTGGSSRAFNRKVSSLGTKSSGTWALTTGIAIA